MAVEERGARRDRMGGLRQRSSNFASKVTYVEAASACQQKRSVGRIDDLVLPWLEDSWNLGKPPSMLRDFPRLSSIRLRM